MKTGNAKRALWVLGLLLVGSVLWAAETDRFKGGSRDGWNVAGTAGYASLIPPPKGTVISIR